MRSTLTRLGGHTRESRVAGPVAALAMAVIGAAGPAAAADPQDAVRGIDVSHYSGAVDWATVREAGFAFAYVKATEGVDGADPAFPDHWRRLAAAGLARGAYHFYVTEDDPEEQARFFLSVVDHRPGDLAPAVDVETLGRGTQPGLAARLRRFLQVVEDAVGCRPIVYTSPKFWDAHVGPGFGEHLLWVAEYGAAAPRLPSGWKRWTLWQHEDASGIAGVGKDADLNRLHPEITLDDLRIPKR